MKLDLVTCGSLGDINPFLALGRTLASRGHDVLVHTHPLFEQNVGNAGLRFSPVAEVVPLEETLRDPRLSRPSSAVRLNLHNMYLSIPSGVATLDRRFAERRPDAVAAHSNCFVTRWACERNEIPLAITTLTPTKWYTSRAGVSCLQRTPGRAGAALASLLQAFVPVAEWAGGLPLHWFQHRCGYGPGPYRLRQHFFGEAVNLGLWSPHFRAAADGDPPSAVVCGFPFYDESDRRHCEEDEERLDRFLCEGEAPVVFSLGTCIANSGGDFYSIAAEACRRLGRRGILLSGATGRPPGSLPPGVIGFDYLPLSRVLPAARAIVHHGGIGTIAQAMSQGLPMVIVPHSGDQLNNAVRAESLGIASTIQRRRLTAPRLQAALESASPTVTHRRLSRAIRREDGALQAALQLERIASGGASAGSAVATGPSEASRAHSGAP